jgi:flagellar hook-associated protein 3 FlgL
MRITTATIQRNTLSDINRAYTRMSNTQAQAASGKVLTKPSDDPAAVGRALALRQSLAATQQYKTNVDAATGWQDATETALGSIQDAVRLARTLTVQGGSDTSSQDSRNAIADQIDQLIEAVKGDANASYQGAYLFSGTATGTAPYQSGATDTYQGDLGGSDPAVAGIVREIGPGVTMTVNTVGKDVLGQGGGDGGILDTLRQISANLKSGNGAALRGANLTALDAGIDTITSLRSANGAKTNRLEAASDRLAQLEQTTTKQVSDTEDADIAETLINLNSQQAAYQASLRAGAQILQTSLLDFLR